MNNDGVLKIMKTAADMWIGFCLAWLWFGEVVFWQLLLYEFVGIFVIYIIGAIIILITNR